MHQPLPYCVYVLRSDDDGKFYIGFTRSLSRRLHDHFSGQVTSTRHRRPLSLIHCEFYACKSDALRREQYFKTTKGKRVLRLMLQGALR